jgi:D-alanyl-D-alanine carboxypeptidase
MKVLLALLVVRDLAPGPKPNTSWAGAAGALVSTAHDLGPFYRSLPRLLGPEQLAAMKTGDPYGLGLFKVRTACGEAWGHDARVPGFLAHAYVRGERQVVLLADEQPLTERQEAAVNRTLVAALCS